MPFPQERPRRLRATAALRRMVRETQVTADDFIYPMFVTEGRGVRKAVSSMPEVFQLSVDELVKEVAEVVELGIPAIDLFGVPRAKDLKGKHAIAKRGLIPDAIKAVKDAYPDLIVMTDVCLCEWLSHGHCGIVHGEEIVNDESLEVLAKMALAHAQAGVDIV